MSSPSAEVPYSGVRYTLNGVAFLLRVPRTTIKQWANGYTTVTRGREIKKPGVLQTEREDEPTLFTFPELIELLFVKELTHPQPNEKSSSKLMRKKLGELVTIAQNLRPQLGEYPFARADFKRVGNQLVTAKLLPQPNANVVTLFDTGAGQGQTQFLTNPQTMQHLADYADELAQNLVFRDDIAAVWYPKEDHVVRLDADMRFGAPIVPSGRTVETIYNRFKLDGEDLEDTADWFGIPVEEVKAAVKFQEEWLAA
ncbi:MAG TPA: hypothetical protein VGL56_02340 [Fimbriimonadaceae bacterium]|jgi:hypothetical protein